MKIITKIIGDFTFKKMEEDFYIVFHPFWIWCERVENGKKIIRLKAK